MRLPILIEIAVRIVEIAANGPAHVLIDIGVSLIPKTVKV